MSWSERVISGMVDHFPVLAGMALLWWKGTPYLVRQSLENGGGEAVRKVVDAANADQTERNRGALREALADHEKVERRELTLALEVVTAREDGKGRACSAGIHAEMAVIRGRLDALEEG